MPTETYVAIVGVVAAFGLFGLVLAWVHWHTRDVFPKGALKSFD